MIAVAVVAAVIVGDHVALRAEPDRTGSQKATLWKGDWLEVRGERKGWLEVWDYRRSRPGWIAASNARVIDLDKTDARDLRAVVDFVTDTPGSESLGIAYAGLVLKKATPDAALEVEIGTMATRLARRVSSGSVDATAGEQLSVAETWGIRFTSVGSTVCYDGAEFRAALALKPTTADSATAVLGLTDPACEPANLGATARRDREADQLAVLSKVDPTQAPPVLANALRIRRASLSARLAWATAMTGDASAAAKHAEAAESAFLTVDKSQLADDDRPAYDEASMLVAASHGAAQPPPKQAPLTVSAKGCMSLAPTKCTHGQVWLGSLSTSPDGRYAAVNVEPLPGWSELWLFHKAGDAWSVEILAPSTDGVDLGSLELLGWSPDGKHALVARQTRVDGELVRSLEDLTLATRETTKAGKTARSWKR